MGAVLYLAIWAWWCPRGKRVLLVYSDSPIWRDYFDAKVLPRLGDQAVVLNWSERKRWPRFTSLAVNAFHYFAGYREFNPLAVVFRPFRPRRIYRYWQPFREYRQGKPEAVETMTESLFALLDERTEEMLG
ncbi:MAG TPA: hypothetical protein VLE48_13580 [Terriglobales bacterium]|nr:hypothetical protein [Terriglobales bacterium]